MSRRERLAKAMGPAMRPAEIGAPRSPAYARRGNRLAPTKRDGSAGEAREPAGGYRRPGISEKPGFCPIAASGTRLAEGVAWLRPGFAWTALSAPGRLSGAPGMDPGGRESPFAAPEFGPQGNTRSFRGYRFDQRSHRTRGESSCC